MKENNGKAVRRSWLKRTTVVGALLVLLVLTASWVNPFEENVPRPGRRRRRQPGTRRAPLRRRKNDNDDGSSSSSDEPPDDNEELIQSILRGEVTLVRLEAHHVQFDQDGHYSNARGVFCPIDWRRHKEDPSTTPMFRDVLAQSPPCPHSTSVELFPLLQRVRAYDREDTASGSSSSNHPHVLSLGGAVFHESRCGSTLVANLLQAAHPSQHRVYSEAPPPVEALRLGQRFPAAPDVVVPLVRDVIYLLSRSTDPAETHVFFKLQSVGSRDMATFRAAFPDAPFLFVFRDPVEVLMSHFARGPSQVRQANCARSYATPPRAVRERLRQARPARGGNKPSVEEFCAAHLATLTETALQQVAASEGRGRVVEYTQLPDVLWETVWPSWGVTLSHADRQRLQATAGQYSKGRGERAGRTFETDSAHKQEAAWEQVQWAAQTYLQPSYQELQALAAGGT